MFRFLEIYIFFQKGFSTVIQKNGKNIRKFRFQGGVTVKLHSLEFLLTNQKHDSLPNLKLILNLMKSL